MKILPFTGSIKSGIVSSGARIKRASVYGYQVATRTAQIYKQSEAKRILNITRSVSSKLINGTTLNELPYLCGAVGLIIPLPFASPILMGIGFLARYFSNGADNLYKHKNKAHTNIPIK